MNIEIIKKDVKAFRTRIHPDGRITMSVPRRASIDSINKEIERVKPWIDKNYKRVIDETLFCKLEDKGYLYILGNKYNIKVINSDRNICYRNNDILYVESSDNRIDIIINKYLDELRNDIYKKCVDKYLNILDLKVNNIVIKSYKSSYGKCNVKTKTIYLSSELIYKNIEFIEAVCLHEVCHLIEANHGSNFYKIIYNIMPDYKLRHQHLKN